MPLIVDKDNEESQVVVQPGTELVAFEFAFAFAEVQSWVESSARQRLPSLGSVDAMNSKEEKLASLA